jgi:hypothetical protein
MSRVTNCILAFHICENEEYMISVINGWIAEKYEGQKFVDISELCGGSKGMEQPTYAAAFNFFSIPALCDFIRMGNWEYPDSVQLIVCDEDENKYKILYPLMKK